MNGYGRTVHSQIIYPKPDAIVLKDDTDFKLGDRMLPSSTGYCRDVTKLAQADCQ
jgi:hypothetical protein